MKIYDIFKLVASSVIVVLVAGCGSSGGGGDNNTTPTDNNSQSVARTLSVNFLESSQSVSLASSYFKLKSDTPINEGLLPYVNGSADKYISDYVEGSSIDYDIAVPADTQTYGQMANSNIKYVGYLLYPSIKDTNYTSPQTITGWTFPSNISQMEESKESDPIFLDNNKKYPLLIFSHGARGNPINDTDLNTISELATKNYIVATLFHGDMRFDSYLNGKNTPEDITLRALSVSKLIDFLQTSKYANHIDFNKIGVYGVSYGGATAFTLIGGKPLDKSSAVGGTLNGTIKDDRIKVAVGIVPFMGDNSFPEVMGKLVTFFGWGSSGAQNISTPYLAITGTSDEEAVEKYSVEVLQNTLSNSYQVSMEQESHAMTNNGNQTAKTWAYYFLDYYLNSNQTFLSIKDVEGDPVDTFRQVN
jgi:dienelactone hydrolase